MQSETYSTTLQMTAPVSNIHRKLTRQNFAHKSVADKVIATPARLRSGQATMMLWKYIAGIKKRKYLV